MLVQAFQFIYSSLFGVVILGNICHTENGTEYGRKAVNAYVESNHGADGILFLDPYFKHDIENLNNEKILDAGCGAAPWAIYAAKHGGELYAIDLQEDMIKEAKKAIRSENLMDKISIVQGDVASLPYDANFFDKAISICVGCNLPPNTFEKHFQECWRTLKRDGVLVVGAPTSLDIVFSNDSKTEEEIALHIKEVLSQLPDNPTSELISECLTQLGEVLSASFYINNNRLSLVTNEEDLQEGTKIWRKLPKLVVPNRYYSQNYYFETFKKYNFDLQKIDLPHFKSEDERVAYNISVASNLRLGQTYVAHAPFIIFHVKKNAY